MWHAKHKHIHIHILTHKHTLAVCLQIKKKPIKYFLQPHNQYRKWWSVKLRENKEQCSSEEEFFVVVVFNFSALLTGSSLLWKESVSHMAVLIIAVFIWALYLTLYLSSHQ